MDTERLRRLASQIKQKEETDRSLRAAHARTVETRGSAASPRQSAVKASRVRDLAHGMKRLGCTLAEGEERVGEAIAALLQESRAGQVGPVSTMAMLTDEAILLRALRCGKP